jgi:hypothetical protein
MPALVTTAFCWTVLAADAPEDETEPKLDDMFLLEDEEEPLPVDVFLLEDDVLPDEVF